MGPEARRNICKKTIQDTAEFQKTIKKLHVFMFFRLFGDEMDFKTFFLV